MITEAQKRVLELGLKGPVIKKRGWGSSFSVINTLRFHAPTTAVKACEDNGWMDDGRTTEAGCIALALADKS